MSPALLAVILSALPKLATVFAGLFGKSASFDDVWSLVTLELPVDTAEAVKPYVQAAWQEVASGDAAAAWQQLQAHLQAGGVITHALPLDLDALRAQLEDSAPTVRP